MAHLNYLFVLITFAFVVSTGIHLFSRGFLLTRSTRVEKRGCDKYLISIDGNQCLSDDKTTCNGEKVDEFLRKNINSTADTLCFERKSKVIILLIDALKYEFGLFDENLTDPLPYQNKLPVLQKLMQNYPDNTRMLKFIADPPTTTLQRLKGMTTGSLPTFIDMGSNFATPEINEDNVIDQIYVNNMSTIFLGDSTWTELFPKRFKRKYSYPSFNIHDLDTVDNAILKRLPDEMRKNDWDLLIAHFLGVDHCGHKHGPLHREMSRKLTEMNEVIQSLAQTIDDDTLLIVMGDHGMTISGDHGGASVDETEALLFAYSKQKAFVPTKYDNDAQSIQQIDLAPTLSTILGIPVPFSNLGSLSLQLLPDVSIDGLHRHELLLSHMWQNAKQIQNYFSKFSGENEKTFTFDDLDEIATKFEVFEHRVYAVHTNEAFLDFSSDLKIHLENLLELCRNIWIKFNPQLMTQGMLIAFVGIFEAFILINNVPLKDFPKVFNNKIILFSTSTSFIIAAIGYIFYEDLQWEDEILCALFAAAIWNILIFGYLIIQNWLTISNEMSSIKRMINIVPRISFAFSIMVFFSNSFIVNEQKILCYLLMSQIIYTTYELRKSTTVLDLKGKMKLNLVMSSTFVKITLVSTGILVLLRMSNKYFKCREEQGDCWQLMTNTDGNHKEDISKMDLAPVIVLALFITVARIFLKTSGNLTGFSPHVLITKFGPTLSVIAACGHLILTQNQAAKSAIPLVHLDILAWIVYGVFLIQVIVIVISPLLTYSIPQKSDQVRVSNHGNMIPELFRHFKNVFNEGRISSSRQIPIIYGLATVYSSVFIAISSSLGILLALLLGAKVSNGFVITVAVAIGTLFIYSVLRYETTETAKECLQPNFSLVLTWFLLVNFGFYATSHQPTISQIDWNAAFVGRTAFFDHSNIMSGLLVVASTFNSNILLLTIYPLLVLFPFMIYAVFPQLSLKNFAMDRKTKEEITSDYRKITLKDSCDEESSTSSSRTGFDVTRGEINLFENENLFMSSVFKVGCQLMILQSIKVLASMIACTILCRHLMVWKIFAPRFIYEGISSYVSFIAIVFGFLLVMRIHSSVKSLVDKINKES